MFLLKDRYLWNLDDNITSKWLEKNYEYFNLMKRYRKFIIIYQNLSFKRIFADENIKRKITIEDMNCSKNLKLIVNVKIEFLAPLCINS